MSADLPIIYEFRCKICSMAQSHPELYKDLHLQVLEMGMNHNRAMNYINARMDRENITLTKLNNQNLASHFASHITIPDRVNAELVKIQPGQQALSDVVPEVSTYIEDMVRRKVGNEVNDYLNLDHLRAQMMEKLEILDEIVQFEDDKGKKGVDLEAMTTYTSLIKEIRATITDLNKIRSSKQLMNLIIKSLIERSTFEIVQKLSREYDQVRKDLLEAGVDNSIVIRIDQNQRMRLAEIVATTARQAVAEVTRAYKLH